MPILRVIVLINGDNLVTGHKSQELAVAIPDLLQVLVKHINEALRVIQMILLGNNFLVRVIIPILLKVTLLGHRMYPILGDISVFNSAADPIECVLKAEDTRLKVDDAPCTKLVCAGQGLLAGLDVEH